MLFGHEIGINLPALLIALVITTVLAIGIKESAKFNSTIVVVKVAVVLFVLGLGAKYVHPGNWGADWHSFAPYGWGGIGAGAAYIFFAYIGFDAVSTTAQEAKNPQRDLPIGMIASLLVCTLLYIGVAAVLTGMVPWQSVNIEAPIARAFLDRGLTWASDVIVVGALAGLTSVMLVMLLGRLVCSMRWRAMACFRRSSSPRCIRGSARRSRTPSWWVHWPALVGARDSDRRHRQDGEYRNAAGICDRLHCDHGSAQDRSGQRSGRSARRGFRSCRSWESCSTAT